ncbi:Gfo/Idh/MocA family protein [Parapedobacter tibetensis]|uniref:Gfo/Idh/MocA family protein n=1 Tax=Parapedobacter tibetensis TaxID=2972951 RepID=UPI00214DBD14|nr:Gfo/Idh/MocA family oxidoreductase [Parapedobacter tibetensis]
MNRRKFVVKGGMALAGITVVPYTFFMENNVGIEPIRSALIGCGSRGMGLANVLKEVKSTALVAYCDINTDHLSLASQSIKGKGYTDYLKLLERNDIKAVFIATPLNWHYQMAVDALDAGKHIYLEKTMTYDIPQAIELESKVNQRPRQVFQVGHQYRHYEMYRKIKEAIDKGWIGRVYHYECQYHRNSDWRKQASTETERQINWRMYREYSGGLMAELCAHQIDVVNWMEDSHPLKVTGLGGIDYWKDGRETYDNVRVIFEYPGGVKSSVSSILSNQFNGYTIRILGTKGTIVVEREGAKIFREPVQRKLGTVDGVTGATMSTDMDFKEGEKLEYADDGREPTYHALQAFVDSIVQGKNPFSGAKSGKETAISVHMANESMRSGTLQHWKNEYDGRIF